MGKLARRARRRPRRVGDRQRRPQHLDRASSPRRSSCASTRGPAASPSGCDPRGSPSKLALGFGSLWVGVRVARRERRARALQPARRRALAPRRCAAGSPGSPRSPARSGSSSIAARRSLRVDPRTGAARPWERLGGEGLQGRLAGGGLLWVTLGGADMRRPGRPAPAQHHEHDRGPQPGHGGGRRRTASTSPATPITRSASSTSKDSARASRSMSPTTRSRSPPTTAGSGSPGPPSTRVTRIAYR